MKIDKAIEELNTYNSATWETRFITFSKALQLGIEALKREEWRRARYANDEVRLLPGETED